MMVEFILFSMAVVCLAVAALAISVTVEVIRDIWFR
jgi:hypothetical protein